MHRKDYEVLKTQMKKIFQNQPVAEEELVSGSAELEELQRALIYLGTCTIEMNRFADDIGKGILDGPQPDRHNYLASGLKNLHSVLRHLSWQTQQVASGDYHQRISFLGDFSTSFNTMVQQLDDRERKLKETAADLKSANSFLRRVMDGHSDWILVARETDNAIVYNNRFKTQHLDYFSLAAMHFDELEACPVDEADNNSTFDHHIPSNCNIYFSKEDGRYHSITSQPTRWNGEDATIHYISDVTQQRLTQQNLSEIAYIDALTGVYNRRYGLIQLDRLLREKCTFSLVMVDINNLKHVNDNFGHSEGDSYICAVVRTLRDHVRDGDIICRMGGDEFILLLTNCDKTRADDKLDCVHNTLRSIDSSNYLLSISYGTVYVDDTNTLSPSALLDKSDEIMYAYKQLHKKTQKEKGGL